MAVFSVFNFICANRQGMRGSNKTTMWNCPLCLTHAYFRLPAKDAGSKDDKAQLGWLGERIKLGEGEGPYSPVDN